METTQTLAQFDSKSLSSQGLTWLFTCLLRRVLQSLMPSPIGERLERFPLDEEVPGAAVTVSGPQLPIPPAMDGSLMPTVLPPGLLPPKTALAAGIKETIAMFRNLQEQGRLDTRDIDE